MANKGAAGSTATFNSTAIGTVRSISFSEDGNAVDVTDLGSATHEVVLGVPTLECTLECVGGSALSVGATGALAIAWFDGTSEAMSSAIITAAETSGDLDGEIVTSYTLQPYGG